MKHLTPVLTVPAIGRPGMVTARTAPDDASAATVTMRGTRRRVLASFACAGLSLWLAPVAQLYAQTTPALLLMAGAGYKRPVEALCAAFTQATGVAVERSYGNLQQVFAQAKASGRVDVLVGDADFIDKAQDLKLPQRVLLGHGILALAWRRNLPVPGGLSGLAGVRELLATPTYSVTLPNPQQAIYGNATRQLLQAQGLWDGLQERLKVVGTVPQVSAYLTAGEVDFGFMNLTEALAVKDKLGGFIQVPSGAGSYAAVNIVAAMPDVSKLPEAPVNQAQFAHFLGTPVAQDILRRAGL
ncbi:substrate-binding domain-containing protein [Rhodoferax sp.]|uniref:molybdate ABC transporter substrate-binding protein n=1 Tax=Rhodoferax sp. TaxID=50421 RepID=UPI00283FE095|nr:substrate-binding domain-containing protein [Rhodoferax sp.]MDR3369521.1 substrate-binding domain-containing protein [Rhodoferax sp.]